MRILVAGHVIFGKVQEFCLSLTIPFLDVHQILTWDDDWETLVLLNTNGGWYTSFASRLKMTSWACLVESVLKFVYHCKVQLFIIFKPLLRSFAGVWVSCTTGNKEVLSANSFTLVVRPSVRSLMQIKNIKEPRIEPWGTPALVFFQVETCPFRITRCFLSD